MTKPNILLIVSDDHGYADRGYLGHDQRVQTPALDRLAAEGVDCTDAYVTAPICSPSRAGLIAGQYQQRWGAHWFGDSEFPDHLPSLAERLGALGYRCGYFGKVHYGREDVGDRACPPQHGFHETFYGLAGKQQGRLNYLRHSTAAVEEYGPEASWRMAVQPMLTGDTEVELEGFLTDEIGDRAGTFIEQNSIDPNRAQPFFAMVAFNAVHNFCWQLPAEELQARGLPVHEDWHDADEVGYADWYDGAISPNLPHGREYYLAQLELMDIQIGRLLDRLDRLGIADDTIVIYLTDNGGSPCNYGDNTPLSGSKYTLWEGGIRVPFLTRWTAGNWTGGRTVDAPVSSLDLLPTLLTAGGAEEIADTDGIDLGPALSDQTPPDRGQSDRTPPDRIPPGDAGDHDRILHWDCGFQWAVRHGNLKLRWCDGDGRQAAGIRAVEHADPGNGFGLYDLRQDPGERNDLAAARPAEVTRLTELHESWRDSVRSG